MSKPNDTAYASVAVATLGAAALVDILAGDSRQSIVIALMVLLVLFSAIWPMAFLTPRTWNQNQRAKRVAYRHLPTLTASGLLSPAVMGFVSETQLVPVVAVGLGVVALTHMLGLLLTQLRVIEFSSAAVWAGAAGVGAGLAEGLYPEPLAWPVSLILFALYGFSMTISTSALIRASSAPPQS